MPEWGYPRSGDLKQLEEENAKLKRLVVDLTLDKMKLQDALRKSDEARPVPRGRPPLVGGLRSIRALRLQGDGLRAGCPQIPVLP